MKIRAALLCAILCGSAFCLNASALSQQKPEIRAIYYAAESGGEMAEMDLKSHKEIKVVHQFKELQKGSQAGIAIWIDKNVADQVEPKWLNESPQVMNPIVLVGYSDTLYAFREKLDAFGIEGPSVDWNHIQVKPGFSVWLWKEHLDGAKSAWNKGFDQTATVEHIEEITDLLLAGKLII